MKISVISTTYNDVSYVDRWYYGLSNQTYTDFEVLVHDDASTDGTFEKLTKICSKDNRFKLERSPQNHGFDGFWVALNSLFAKAKGKLVVGLAVDDFIIDFDFYRKAINAFRNYPSLGGFYGRCALYSESNSKIIGVMGSGIDGEVLIGEKLMKEFLSGNVFIPGHSLVMNKEHIEKLGLLHKEYGPQSDFFSNHALAALYGILFSPDTFTCMNVKENKGNYSCQGSLWEMTARLEAVEKKFRELIPFTDEIEALMPAWRPRWTLDSIRKTGVQL